MDLDARVADLERRLAVAEDQLAIMRLLASYGPSVDCGEAHAAAQLWASDGAYDVGGLVRAEGEEQIAALYEADGHQSLIAQGSGHLTMAPRITVSGDTATAVAYSMVCLRGADGWDIWRASANHWTLTRTQAGWRIAERFNRVLDGSADSHEVLRRAASP